MWQEPFDKKDLGSQLQVIESVPFILLMDRQLMKIPFQPFFLVMKVKRKNQEEHCLESHWRKTWGKVILHLSLQLLKRGSTTASNFCNFFFRSNIIFYDSHLFLPATYTLRVLIDVPPLVNFFWFFSYLLPPPPTPCSNIPPLFIIFSNLFEPIFFFIHIDWYTCKILSNLVNFPYFNSCLGLVFI